MSDSENFLFGVEIQAYNLLKEYRTGREQAVNKCGIDVLVAYDN
jgi:hypothetical protein